MSKLSVYLSLFGLLIANLLGAPKVGAAGETCEQLGISYGPTLFSENSNDITLEVKINNPNVLDSIKGRYIKLRFGYGVFGNQVQGSDSQQISSEPTISQTYKMTLDDGNLRSRGRHTGALVVGSENKAKDDFTGYSDLCTEMVYDVGFGTVSCQVVSSLPSAVPPVSKIDLIQFRGRADTEYELNRVSNTITGSDKQSLSKAPTDKYGNGQFTDILITGSGGSSFFFQVTPGSNTGLGNCYSKEIKISTGAAPPPPIKPVDPVGPGPVQNPSNQPQGCTGDNCTNSAGVFCDEPKNTQLRTAIGCVPTDPATLINSLLRFAVGISGGIALLLLIWGSFEMATSGGDPKALGEGRSRFVNALIGLLFILFSVILLKILSIDILGLNNFTSAIKGP